MPVYPTIRKFAGASTVTGLNRNLGVIYVLDSVLRESSLPLSL